MDKLIWSLLFIIYNIIVEALVFFSNLQTTAVEMRDPVINPKYFGIGIPNPVGPPMFRGLEIPRYTKIKLLKLEIKY